LFDLFWRVIFDNKELGLNLAMSRAGSRGAILCTRAFIEGLFQTEVPWQFLQANMGFAVETG